MVAQPCNPSTLGELRQGGLRVQDQPRLHSTALFQKNKQKQQQQNPTPQIKQKDHTHTHTHHTQLSFLLSPRMQQKKK
jgi:hypothetical protein